MKRKLCPASRDHAFLAWLAWVWCCIAVSAFVVAIVIMHLPRALVQPVHSILSIMVSAGIAVIMLWIVRSRVREVYGKSPYRGPWIEGVPAWTYPSVVAFSLPFGYRALQLQLGWQWDDISALLFW